MENFNFANTFVLKLIQRSKKIAINPAYMEIIFHLFLCTGIAVVTIHFVLVDLFRETTSVCATMVIFEMN